MAATARHADVDQSDREIVHVREFDAPRELVWKVWTDPNHLANWWGPVGFSTTTKHYDLKPGGEWRFTMHGPGGHDYPNLITFVEIVAPERLVYKHGGGKDNEPVNFTTTVTFENIGGKTRLTMRAVFPTAAAREFVVKTYGADEGGRQTLSRLGDHLATLASNGARSNPFTIRRVLKAPRDLVFKVWTQQEHLAKWFGPKGMTIPQCSLDLRVGGVFHYCLTAPDGSTMWGKWVFREIISGERLVFVSGFSDESGATTRAPFSGQWPLEMLTTVTFADHAGIGRGTVVTISTEAINATPEEQKTFDAMHGSMTQGWGGTFDQLAEYLERT